MAAEHETVVELARIEITRQGGRLFKNAQGSGWVGGKTLKTEPWSTGLHVELVGARRVKFGVQNPGGSDLIGWRPLVITADMVGQTVAQFLAVEAKTPSYDRASVDQKRFLSQVASAGGSAMIARQEGDGLAFAEVIK